MLSLRWYARRQPGLAILTFDERQVYSSNAHSAPRHRRPMTRWSAEEIIDLDETIAERTSQQDRQFDVGNQMKTAGEVITRDRFDSAGSRNSYAFESLVAVGGERPAACGKGNPSDLSFQLEPLQNFCGPATQCQGQTRSQASPGCLLRKSPLSRRPAGGGRPRPPGAKGRCPAMITRTSLRNGQATLDHRLQTTGAHHVRQRPTGKR